MVAAVPQLVPLSAGQAGSNICSIKAELWIDSG